MSEAQENKPVAAAGKMASSTGLDENLAGALSYFLTFITGFIFLLIEKDNKFVKFHAMQSIIFGVIFAVVGVGIWFLQILMPSPLDVFFTLVQCAFSVGGFVLWIVLMYKAYSGEMYKLPMIGDMAENQVK